MVDETKAEKIAEASRKLSQVKRELCDRHGQPVAELPSMTVWADTRGYELSELANWMRDEMDVDVDRSDVSQWMHEQARGIDHSWSVADPVVMLHD